MKIGCSCSLCRSWFANWEDFLKHLCKPIFKIEKDAIELEINKIIDSKKTCWNRFVDKFWSFDITYGLAVMGFLIINFILVIHLKLTLAEAVFEGLGLGFVIPRLLK